MPKKNRSKTYFLLLLILSTSHLLNDLMQSLIPASYPLLKEKYALSFIQIGLISLTFQISGALLQPVFGLITDRKAAPYSPVIGMVIYIFWFNKFSICAKLSNNSYFCSFNRYWIFNISS